MFQFNFQADDQGDEGMGGASAAEPADGPATDAPAEIFGMPSAAAVVELMRTIAPASQQISPTLAMAVSEPMSVGALDRIVQTTDIDTGVYEGGLKVWECSVDLVRFLQASNYFVSRPGGCDSVMELGCGHGLPGIYAACAGARNVFLMDYNVDVINSVTIPNVWLNTEHLRQPGAAPPAVAAATGPPNILFCSGDWAKVSEQIPSAPQWPAACRQVQLILSAETIYTQAVTERLYAMLRRHLRFPDGEALLAQKRYYFGTGGSVAHFRGVVEADLTEPRMQVETVQVYEDGASNIREVLKVSYVQ